ncbi:MAG: HU family DNA-binding protein [Clostridia bacterium]|nr:HU family DNA-binding protein [Clostridia bacterium]
MNKQEFIVAVAAEAGFTQADVAKIVNTSLDVITKSLKKGEDVIITGFGKFEARARKARNGINPSTGASIKIAACKVPAFKAGKGLKDAVNA